MTQPVIPSLKRTSGYVPIKGAFQVALTPGAVSNQATVIVTPTVPAYVKCDFGDIILVGPGDAALLGVTVTGYVTAANTIKLSFNNNTAGSITPTAAALYTIIVIPGEAGEFVA